MSGARLAWRWRLLGIVALAVLLRIPPLLVPTLSYDEAVAGLMSQDVLRGRFPIFFYGQPIHGAVDSYFAALFLLMLGPTTTALKLAPLSLFLIFLGSIAQTTRKVFGTEVATIAALLVAVPPYYLFWWAYDARGNYPLMLILGTWSLYLAWRMGQDGVWRTPGRRALLLGFLAGLSVWTHYLSVTFLAPITLGLLGQAARRPREWRPLLARGAIAVGGAAAGMLPLLGYYLWHRLPPGLPGREALPDVPSHLEAMIARALPQILGVHREIWQSGYRIGYALIAASTLGGLVYGAAWWIRSRRRETSGGGTVGLLLGVVVVTVALSLFTRYGAILRYPRYLLPLYLALPVLLALAVHHLGRLSRPLKWLAASVLLLNNLLGFLVTTPVLASPAAVAYQRAWATGIAEQLVFLENHSFRRLYGGPNVWSFLSGRRVLASDPQRERMAEVAQEVDAAREVGWVFDSVSASFERSADAAGIRYRLVPGPGFVVYTGFARPGPAEAEIDAAGWAATASDRPDDAGLTHDRRLATAWRTKGLQAPGAYHQLDLGRRHRVGSLTWLPGSVQEVPAGFRVALSSDAETWHTVASVPAYLGPLYWSGTHPFQRPRRSRVEVRFAAVDARYVRITLTAPGARSWSIRELFVGAPVTECRHEYDLEGLMGVLRATGVQFAYADHWFSANIGKASRGRIGVLPANTSVNSYRLERPDPDTIERLRLTPRHAIVVEACPGQTSDAVATLLRDSGVAFSRHAVGGVVVFGDLRAPSYPGMAAPWRPPGPGGGPLEVALDTPYRAAYVAVSCRTPLAGSVSPEQLGLETSDDGRTFVPTPFRLVQPGELRMSGSRVFRDDVSALVLEMAPRHLLALRITPRAGDWPWCPVSEVRLGGEAA